jgi:hypothetical protein
MVKHRASTKRKAIDVAAFVFVCEFQKLRIEKGEDSYRKVISKDAHWAEWFVNRHRLPKGSIYRQAAKKFGYKDTKQIQRLLRLVEREGWGNEVVAELE